MTVIQAKYLMQRHVGCGIGLTRPDGGTAHGVIRWLILDCALVTVAVEHDADDEATSYHLQLTDEVNLTLTPQAAAAEADAAWTRVRILRRLAQQFADMASVGGSPANTQALQIAPAFARERADDIAAGKHDMFTGTPLEADGPDELVGDAVEALTEVLLLLDRLDESGQDYDTDMIRAAVPQPMRDRLTAAPAPR